MTAPTLTCRARSLAVLLMAGAALAACATPQPRYAYHRPDTGPAEGAARGQGAAQPRYKVGEPYQVGGIWYVPREQPDYDVTGIASWYGDQFNLQPTANGEIFDMTAVSGAHTTLPLPSIVEVTNLDNGRRLNVRINDRGPFVGNRVIDLSRAAARELGYEEKGLARVRVRYVGPAPLPGEDSRRMADIRREAPRPRYETRAAPVQLAAAAPVPVPPVPAPPLPSFVPPTPSAPVAVSQAELPPLSGPAAAPTVPALAPVQAAVASTPVSGPIQAAGQFRIQAGAFSDADNAARVAASLGQAGAAVIEPVVRDGITYYRVILPSGADEGEAWMLRDKVAALGYADARVLRPF